MTMPMPSTGGQNMTFAVMNSTMSMVMKNMTSMDHDMHNMSMVNATKGMDHSMNDHMDHAWTMDHGPSMTTQGAMDHHGDGMTDSNMIHNHGGITDGNGHADHGGAAIHDTYFGFQLPIRVLFFDWEVSTQGQLAVACVVWCILAIVHEGLKSLREYILYRMGGSEHKYLMKSKNGRANRNGKPRERSCLRKVFNGWHILLSILQIVHTTLGMFLMLVYMTFNVWLAISVSLGSGVGYWLFAWNKRSAGQYDDDHCV